MDQHSEIDVELAFDHFSETFFAKVLNRTELKRLDEPNEIEYQAHGSDNHGDDEAIDRDRFVRFDGQTDDTGDRAEQRHRDTEESALGAVGPVLRVLLPAFDERLGGRQTDTVDEVMSGTRDKGRVCKHDSKEELEATEDQETGTGFGGRVLMPVFAMIVIMSIFGHRYSPPLQELGDRTV